MVKPAKGWIPNRQDIIWIDCNPQRGKEMRDVHPFLVLSPNAFNKRTSLVIGLPMTTATYNANNPFAVAAGIAGGRLRAGAPHPMKRITDARFAEVLALLNQIVQLT